MQVKRPITIEVVQRIIRGRLPRGADRPILAKRIGPTKWLGPIVEKTGVVVDSPAVLVPALPSVDSPGRDVKLNPAELRQEEVYRRAFSDALYEAPPIFVQSSPQEDPGVLGRSTEWVPPGGVVIVQGGSAGAIAAADALRLGVAHVMGAAALGLLSPVAMGSSGAAVAIWSFLAPDDRSIVARRFKLDVSEPSAYVALQFAIDVAGEQNLTFFNMKKDEWFPLNVAAKPGTSISIMVSCLKATAAYILKPKVDGWTIPVGMIDDSLTARTRRNDRRSPV